MSWGKGVSANRTHQEIAEQVLQLYMKSLQDPKSLKNILSEYSALDYFGKRFYGQENVLSHLLSNLHGSSYELSSLSINEQPAIVPWNPVTTPQDNHEEDLGVTLISPQKFTFPSLTFSTPVRSTSDVTNRENRYKIRKIDEIGEQSNSAKKSEDKPQDLLLSSPTAQTIFSNDIKHLTAYGTIRYPKRVFPTMDPKRIKHHSLISLRDRFCQLCIGFECNEHVVSITNCKLWTIKYSFSSKVTPRNLLKAFNEVDMN